MCVRISLLLVFFACLVSLPVAGEQQPLRDPQALALLDRAMVAMGGGRAVQIQDSVVQTSIVLPGETSAGARGAVIKTRGPDQMWWEGTGGDAGTRWGLDRGREILVRNGRTLLRPNSNARKRCFEHLPFLLVAQELAHSDVAVSYIGQEVIEGRAAHRLKFSRVSSLGEKELDDKLTRDSEFDLYLDVMTLLPLKISYLFLSETDWRRGLLKEVYYSDYRLLNGILLPFQQRVVFNHRTLYELHIQSALFNVGLANSDWKDR